MGLGAVAGLGLEDEVVAVVLLGSSGLWWGVWAGLDLDEDLCGDLGDVDVLGGDFDLGGDGSLGVGKDGSLNEGVVGLGLGPGVDDTGPTSAASGVLLGFPLSLLLSGQWLIDVGESWPPVLILLHTTPVRLKCRLAGLDLAEDLGEILVM